MLKKDAFDSAVDGPLDGAIKGAHEGTPEDSSKDVINTNHKQYKHSFKIRLKNHIQ